MHLVSKLFVFFTEQNIENGYGWHQTQLTTVECMFLQLLTLSAEDSDDRKFCVLIRWNAANQCFQTFNIYYLAYQYLFALLKACYPFCEWNTVCHVMSCHINHVTYHYTELSWTYHFNNCYYFTDVIFYCISESNKFYACKFVSKSSLIHVGHYFIKSQRVKYLSCLMEWLRSWNCQSYHFLLLRKVERDDYKSTKD